MPKIISEQTKLEIRAMLTRGIVGDEIADKTNVSIGTVNKIRKEVELEGHDLWHSPGKLSRFIKTN